MAVSINEIFPKSGFYKRSFARHAQKNRLFLTFLINTSIHRSQLGRQSQVFIYRTVLTVRSLTISVLAVPGAYQTTLNQLRLTWVKISLSQTLRRNICCRDHFSRLWSGSMKYSVLMAKNSFQILDKLELQNFRATKWILHL